MKSNSATRATLPSRILSVFLRLGRLRAWWLTGLVWPVMAWPALKTDPYLLLPDAGTLRICFEVDRPREHRVVVPTAEGSKVFPARYLKSREDTFLAYAELPAKLLPKGAVYEIMEEETRAGRYTMTSDWGGLGQRAPRLVVYGDSQGGPKVLRQLSEHWSKEPPDLVICVGDAVDYGSTYQDWKHEFFDALRTILPGCPVLIVAGNHEAYRDRTFYWYDFWFNQLSGRRFGALEQGPVRLLWINDSDLHSQYGIDTLAPFSEQLRWLQTTLWKPAATPSLGMVFCHVPFISRSTITSDYGSAALRDQALPAIVTGQVAAVIAGHHHKYERIQPSNFGRPLSFITTGGGGGRLFGPENQGGPYRAEAEVFRRHHYIKLDWTGHGYQAVVWALEGDELDRFSIDLPREIAASVLTERAASATEVWARWTRDNSFANATPAARLSDGPIFAKNSDLLIALEPFHKVARSAAKDLTLIGIDRSSRQWGYLQGGRFTVRPGEGWQFVETGRAELYPARFLVPIADWSYAQRRSGLNAAGGILAAVAGNRPVNDEGRLHEPEIFLQWGAGKDLLDKLRATNQAPARPASDLEGELAPARTMLATFLRTHLDHEVKVIADAAGRERVILFRLSRIGLAAAVFLDAKGDPYGTCFLPLGELEQFGVGPTKRSLIIRKKGETEPWQFPLAP